jgi:hypothetical protein
MTKKYKKWCERCKRYHTSPPVDINKIINDHGKDIAREIDREALKQIKSSLGYARTGWGNR